MSSPAWNHRRRWKRWEASSAWVWKEVYQRGRMVWDEDEHYWYLRAPEGYETKALYWAANSTKAKKARFAALQARYPERFPRTPRSKKSGGIF